MAPRRQVRAAAARGTLLSPKAKVNDLPMRSYGPVLVDTDACTPVLACVSPLPVGRAWR